MVDDPSSTAPQPTPWRSFVRLMAFWGPYRTQVVTSALLCFAVVGARLVIPDQMGDISDAINERRFDDLDRGIVTLLAAATFMAIFNASRRVISGQISLGLEQHMRERLFDHLARLGLRYFDERQTGQLLSRVTSDVTMVRFFLGYGSIYFFMHAATIVVVPVILWLTAPRLAVIVYVMMPVLVWTSIRYSRRSHVLLRESQQRLADVTAHGEETIVGARVVRAFGQEDRESARFRELVDELVAVERRVVTIDARYRPLYELLPNVALAAIFLVGMSQIADGSLRPGAFVSFFFYVMLLTGPLRILGMLLGRAQRAMGSSDRIWELLDADDQMPERSDPLPLPARSPSGSELRFEGVTFAFGAGPPVVDDVTLTIPRGATVALIGPTGCGKSTFTSLLPRFYDPTHGRVLLDGVDLRDLALRDLREVIGIVDQEPFLFSATIAANLRFGRPDATDDELHAALVAAQADEFVDRLPDGVDTVIGERGLTLSGGQRQRLAIARALVVDPRVLILDDATASVDSRVEARISDAMRSAASTRTTIIIAHRPSTIALADLVVVMDEGRIARVGTHEELLATSPLYRLVQEQRGAAGKVTDP